MNQAKEYPLIENLEAISQKAFNQTAEELDAIISVLDEEFLVRLGKPDENVALPDKLSRSARYRWDVALCVFNSDDTRHAIKMRKTQDSVLKYQLLCTHDPEFFDMAVMHFYNFYSEQSGNGLSHDETTQIIKDIFDQQFSQLEKAFEKFLLDHIPRIIIAPDTLQLGLKDKTLFSESEIKHYRKVYKDCFFYPYIEKAIQSLSH